MAGPRGWLGALLLAAGVSGLAYLRRTLTTDGAVAATAVGSLVFRLGGVPGASALLAFFVSASALSRLGRARKARGPLAQAKGAQRDAAQVLANGGVAAACLGLGARGGFLGALAAANADTWATELGMLAAGRPRLITTLRPVETGRSGGVTWAGLLASLGGAGVVGAAWAITTRQVAAVGVAIIAGMVGSVVDSFLGATVQGLYRCTRCGALSEDATHARCGGRGELLSGLSWIGNDAVNALATASGALVGGLAWRAARAQRST